MSDDAEAPLGDRFADAVGFAVEGHRHDRRTGAWSHLAALLPQAPGPAVRTQERR